MFLLSPSSTMKLRLPRCLSTLLRTTSIKSTAMTTHTTTTTRIFRHQKHHFTTKEQSTSHPPQPPTNKAAQTLQTLAQKNATRLYAQQNQQRIQTSRNRVINIKTHYKVLEAKEMETLLTQQEDQRQRKANPTFHSKGPGMQWTCNECSWKNRGENSVCGGGSVTYGCGARYPIKETAAMKKSKNIKRGIEASLNDSRYLQYIDKKVVRDCCHPPCLALLHLAHITGA